MSISKKHHYLPEFYLKGFVNESGNFSVYNYGNSRIKKNEYPPSTHFFEEDRNTIETSVGKTDFLEQAYTMKDTNHAKLFQLIQSTKKPLNLNGDQQLTLMHFASNLFWRIPQNDKLYEEQYEQNPVFKNVWKLYDKETNEEIKGEELERLHNYAPFKKSLQVTAGDFLFMAHNKDDLWKWRLTYSENCFTLCSDNPLIIRDDNAKDLFKTEFILPLTKHHLLIRTFNEIKLKKMPAEFNLLIDLCLFKQGRKFCACSNRDWLNQITLLATKYPIEFLKNRIFTYLEQEDGTDLFSSY